MSKVEEGVESSGSMSIYYSVDGEETFREEQEKFTEW